MEAKYTDGEILLVLVLAAAFVWFGVWHILTFRRIGLNTDRTAKLLEDVRDALGRQEERETRKPS